MAPAPSVAQRRSPQPMTRQDSQARMFRGPAEAKNLNVRQLRNKWSEVYGRGCGSQNMPYLRKAVTYPGVTPRRKAGTRCGVRTEESGGDGGGDADDGSDADGSEEAEADEIEESSEDEEADGGYIVTDRAGSDGEAYRDGEDDGCEQRLFSDESQSGVSESD
jgi:hypothetical protein